MTANKRPYDCLGLILLLLFSTLGHTKDLNQDEALALRQQGLILPLEQFIGQALGRYPGSKLLEAELEEKQGVLIYEIELLTADGVVRELKFDASDIRLLDDKEDD